MISKLLTSIRLPLAVLFISTLAGATVARAQQNPDQDALQQRARDNFDTIRQRMQDKGIDFRDVFTPGMDPSEMSQKLIEKGVIDQDFANQMATTMQKLTASRLRDELQCSDEEYAIMQPLIAKVSAAQSAIGQQGPRFMVFAGTKPSPAAAEVSKAKRALHAAIADVNTTPEQFSSILKDLREAQDKAKDELVVARRELVQVLNVRQEAALTSMGLLD